MEQYSITGHQAYEIYERRGKAEGRDFVDLLEEIRIISESDGGDEE